MKWHSAGILGGVLVLGALAACSNKVDIKAEQSGAASGSTGSTMMTAGSGASGPGGTTGSGGAGTGGSTSSSTGTGTGGASSAKVVTADSDIAQYQSISADLLSMQPVLQGPFFVTDVYANNNVTLATVTGTDCSAPQATVMQLPTTAMNGTFQIHGVRLPVLAGQSLCHNTNVGGTLTILGFRPY